MKLFRGAWVITLCKVSNAFIYSPVSYHCGDGEGPSDIDLLTPMMQWDREISGQYQCQCLWTVGSATYVTRPVYPYPSVAKYVGTWSVDNAVNFEEGEPLNTTLTNYWLGQDFYNPYMPIEG